ncbi:MAG: hypothetical protein HXS52_02760 [Theionarchaea archaeon]|nr:hypothetical protein [Theionarchaea archaeon]MBU7036826.1 hypothetical protein [Theionarchaea archaeon]
MIDCTFFVEAQSNSSMAVESSLRELLTDVETNATVITSKSEEIIEHEVEGTRYYSGVLQIRLKADFRAYINLCMRLTPTAIDVSSGSVSLEPRELLPVFGDISSRISKLSQKLGIAIQNAGRRFQEAPGVDPDFIDETISYGGILMKMVFEGRSDTEERLKETVMETVNSAGAYINKINSRRTEGPDWTGVVGVEVLFEDIEDVFLAVVRLVPVAMSIVEPDTISLSLREIQNIGMDLSEVVHSFVSESIARHI